MSIYQKKTIIKECPVYDVVTLAPAPNGFINLKAGDELITTERLNKYKISSVISSALESGKNPLVSYNRAIENNHNTHYIIPLASVLTSHKQERKTYIQVEIGQLINFEGLIFKIVNESNQNLGLKQQ